MLRYLTENDNRRRDNLIWILCGILVLVFFLSQQCNGQIVRGEKSQRDCIVQSYRAEVGVRELTGNNDGQQVEKYLRSAQLGKGYAWCAAFVNWNMRKCGVIGPQSAAWSPSWFPLERLTKSPLPGDVFGIYFPAKGRIAHVGFIDQWGEVKVRTIEGNTNAAGSREGDGVYIKYRLKKQIFATANWIDP